MRVYGRVRNADGSARWVVVSSDPATGDNSNVYLVALCQALLLNLNESPFFANVGIPAQQSVQQQVAPDYYIARIQQFYAPYFASLVIAKTNPNPPTYSISVITLQGAQINFNLPATASPPNQIPGASIPAPAPIPPSPPPPPPAPSPQNAIFQPLGMP